MNKRLADILLAVWFVLCIGTFFFGLAITPVGEFLLTGQLPKN